MGDADLVVIHPVAECLYGVWTLVEEKDDSIIGRDEEVAHFCEAGAGEEEDVSVDAEWDKVGSDTEADDVSQRAVLYQTSYIELRG